jgi:uncharacterized protein YbjT (DUF2867 family)
MKVIIFGATGMIGSGVLTECLEDGRVGAVLVIGRRSCGRTHPQLGELIRSDLVDYSKVKAELQGYDACFFCLGVSAAGMTEAAYRRVTYDLTIAAAGSLAGLNSHLTFCYFSGQGTDSTERGRFMWARVKGATENRLLAMPMSAYMFRAGFIQPLKGAQSRTGLYRLFYVLTAPFFPVLRRVFPRHVTTTVRGSGDDSRCAQWLLEAHPRNA